MNEQKPLGFFADLWKWKLASRAVVGLIVLLAMVPPCIAISLGFAALRVAFERASGNEMAESLVGWHQTGLPGWLLLPVVGPPLMACLYVNWAMFYRRAHGPGGH